MILRQPRVAVRAACLPGLLAVMMLAGGCAPGSGSVSGTVTFQGKPLTTGTVVFYDAANNSPSSPIQPDGTYKIGKVATGQARIVVMMPMAIYMPGGGDAGRGQDPSMNKVFLPPKYADPGQSGLTCDVKSGVQTHNLQLD